MRWPALQRRVAVSRRKRAHGLPGPGGRADRCRGNADMVSPPLPSLLTASVAVLVLLAIVVIARWSRHWTHYPTRVAAFLSGRWSPAVAGIVTIVAVRIVW